LIDPDAARSTVPAGDGESSMLPATLISPENAVAISAGGMIFATVAKGCKLSSFVSSHGW
jgi:hypothetical protein